MVKPDRKLLKTDDTAIDASISVIRFGGEAWPVPKLGIKQLKLINTKLDRLWEILITNQAPMNTLSDQDWEDLGYVTYVALTRAHPDLTMDEFEDTGTDRQELVFAFMPIITAASGRKKETKPGESAATESP
jgi:hypothetical protein